MLFGYYSLHSTLVFQSAFIPGFTFNECLAIANTGTLQCILPTMPLLTETTDRFISVVKINFYLR
jgi:hypothetical protein